MVSHSLIATQKWPAFKRAKSEVIQGVGGPNRGSRSSLNLLDLAIALNRTMRAVRC